MEETPVTGAWGFLLAWEHTQTFPLFCGRMRGVCQDWAACILGWVQALCGAGMSLNPLHAGILNLSHQTRVMLCRQNPGRFACWATVLPTKLHFQIFLFFQSQGLSHAE